MNPKQILLTGLITILPVSASAQLSKQDSTKLAPLVHYLETKGHKIGSLFQNPSFQIHTDIDDLFKRHKPKPLPDTLTKKQKEKIIEQRYQKYKQRHAFDSLSRRMLVFMEQNKLELELAETMYNVPKETISAILGIETHFGDIQPTHKAFNALVSLYVEGYRQDFAVQNLEKLLEYCEQKNKNIFEIESNFASATGPAQFIPQSYHLFIGDDFYSIPCCIFSIPNYLNEKRKEPGTLDKALLDYNQSKFYQRFVNELSEKAKQNATKTLGSQEKLSKNIN